MKFLMSKALCVPKTQHDIHKELCKKPDLGHSKYEMIGPLDKYRDEYCEVYKMKCDEFKMKGKMVRDKNIKALTNNRPKLGEMYRQIAEDPDLGDIPVHETEKKTSAIHVNSEASLSSLAEIRETGVALRKRHERHYTDTWDVNDKKCNFEPWFRRYLILCRFISAARKIIQKHRLLKRLAVLKALRKNKERKEIIEEYEQQYISIQHLTYPHIWEKFVK